MEGEVGNLLGIRIKKRSPKGFHLTQPGLKEKESQRVSSHTTRL